MSDLRLKDHYSDIGEFEDMLDLAEENARTDWEYEFVADIRDKYDKYVEKMFFSDAQKTALEAIADR